MKIPRSVHWLTLLPIGLSSIGAIAQNNDDSLMDEDIFVLSPFEVTTDSDQGYQATETLAGSRIKTDLKDVASSISVVTSQFMQDTGAKDNESLLVYATNTEVGGIYGNYGGFGNNTGISEVQSLLRPNENTRVRGLDSADNTANYFITSVPWDGYNVDRVDLQRGPNSILFGVGSPAGIINTTTIVANFENGGKLEQRIGSFGSTRYVLDYNQVLVQDVLAVRAALLKDQSKYRQKPAYQNDTRGFLTINFQPQVLDKKWASPLMIKANVEKGKVRSNRPRVLPPLDHLSYFFDPAGMNRQVYDPLYAYYRSQLVGTGGKGVHTDTSAPFFQPDKFVPALTKWSRGSSAVNAMYFENGDSSPYASSVFNGTQRFGIGPDGSIDGSLHLPFSGFLEVTGLNEYAINQNYLDGSLYPEARKGYYKDQTLSDPSVFDFYNKLIDGHNKKEWKDWHTANISIAQTFAQNRFGFEYVYNLESLRQGQMGVLVSGTPYITVDANKYLLKNSPVYAYNDLDGDGNVIDTPESAATGGTLNPNAGRAILGGISPDGQYEHKIEREDHRVTAFAELRASDFMDDESLLTRILGRHILTGLYSESETNQQTSSWKAWATDAEWASMQGMDAFLDSDARSIAPIVYLSNDLRSHTSMSGIQLNALDSIISPRGQMVAAYFDSHWNHPLDPNAVGYVDPSANTYPDPLGGSTTGLKTQSENPANYVGWTQGNLNILNGANPAERKQLINDASKKTDILTSKAITLQSYLWDDLIVGTFGYREDTARTFGTTGSSDPKTHVYSTSIINNSRSDNTFETEGNTTTWGVVFHAPKSVEKLLPEGTTISAFYNNSENFRAENRVGFDAKALPNARGESKDYGIVLSLLDGKLNFKVTRYQTTVTDANLQGTALGDQTYQLFQLEATGTSAAYINKLGLNGIADATGSLTQNWIWNYHWADTGFIYYDPPNGLNDPAYINHPTVVAQNAAIDAWMDNLMPQEWFDAFGYDFNVAALKSADINTFAKGINGGTWSTQSGAFIPSANGNRVAGLYPVGTIDQQSEGWEFELVAKPTENWNLMINASKTKAVRSQLGSSITDFIEMQHAKFEGPAGDIRQWWAGDQPIRNVYRDSVWAAYQFQLEQSGQSAPEIRPWTFNVVSNYGFSEGVLAGSYIGAAFRWQDKSILGYELDDTQSKLDVNRPIHGDTESAFDMWAGYQRNINDKIGWKIQLNIRNLGEDVHLVPISVNPDGTAAAQRIVEGMTWTLSNTFTF